MKESKLERERRCFGRDIGDECTEERLRMIDRRERESGEYTEIMRESGKVIE